MAQPIPCPGCEHPLNVPEEYYGQMVECPDCKYRFLANAPGAAALHAGPPAAAPMASSYEARDESPVSRSSYDDDRRDDTPMRPRGDLQPHRGGMIFWFGILGIFVPLLALLAWILGNSDLKAMQEGRMDPAGESQTRTGRLIGKIIIILNILLAVLGILITCAFFGFVMMVATTDLKAGGH